MDKGKRLAAPVTDALPPGVLLEKYGTKALSEVFSVSTHPVRLLAFGLVGTSRVLIHRVWKMPSAGGWDSCGDMLPGGEQFEMPYRIGCEQIMLTPQIPELVIDAAGDFRVEYVGQDREEVLVVKLTDCIDKVDNLSRGICHEL